MATKEQLNAVSSSMLSFGKGDITLKDSVEQIRTILDPDGTLSDIELKPKVLCLLPDLKEVVHSARATKVEVEVKNPQNLTILSDVDKELDNRVLLSLKIYRTSDDTVQTEILVNIDQADEDLVQIAMDNLDKLSKRIAEK